MAATSATATACSRSERRPGSIAGRSATISKAAKELEAVRSEDALARRMGISGVPTFIFERKYIVSGAQSPEAFLQIFERLAEETAGGDSGSAAEG